MIVFLSDALLAQLLQDLPRFFLFGTPVLLTFVTLAALVDARLPRKFVRESTGREGGST